MAKAVFDNLALETPKNHFTVGITDDVTHTSLPVDSAFSIERPNTVRALFYGLGSDGTVGANKNSIKIIGTETDLYAQGYFVYDSKKSGSVTISHLRFGPEPIRAPYLIESANFIACHQFNFLERFDMLSAAQDGATFLLNSPFGPEDVWDHLPRAAQSAVIQKRLRLYVIDGNGVAQETGMGGRVNTIMQTCFFALSGVLPREEAIEAIKHTIEKTYGKRGESVVRKNFAAVDAALAHLYEVSIPADVSSVIGVRPAVPPEAPEFVQSVTASMIAGHGDELPISALPVDGTYPSGTTRWEKRNIALEIPVWDPDICIQCDKCVLACPHAVIRAKVYSPSALENAPTSFKSADARWKEFPFQQPDVDLELLEIVPRPTLSPVGDKQSLRLPLCWISILDGRIRGSLAASSGIHSATDVLKLLMVGADVTMLASELMLNGIDRLRTIRIELVEWLVEREYTSIRQLQGSLSQRSVSFPAAFERSHYVRAVSGGVPVLR